MAITNNGKKVLQRGQYFFAAGSIIDTDQPTHIEIKTDPAAPYRIGASTTGGRMVFSIDGFTAAQCDAVSDGTTVIGGVQATFACRATQHTSGYYAFEYIIAEK